MKKIKRTLGNLFLNMSNPYNRLFRRGIVMGALFGISVILTGAMALAPEYAPIIAGLLTIIDKALRMQKE